MKVERIVTIIIVIIITTIIFNIIIIKRQIKRVGDRISCLLTRLEKPETKGKKESERNEKAGERGQYNLEEYGTRATKGQGNKHFTKY